MSQLQKKIEMVLSVKDGVEDVIWPSANPVALNRLRKYIQMTFQLELPQSYVALVAKTDGLEFKTMMIFGVTTHVSPYLSSVQEINKVLADVPRRHAYFGGNGEDLYTYCLEDKTWRTLDRATLSPLAEFEDFEGLLCRVLHKACEGIIT